LLYLEAIPEAHSDRDKEDVSDLFLEAVAVLVETFYSIERNEQGSQNNGFLVKRT